MDAIGWNLVSSNTPLSFSVGAETTWLGVIDSPAAVWSGSPLGVFNESGGSPTDQYTWQLGGAAASAFNLAEWGTEANLYAGGKSLTGGPSGTLYGFTLTETDTTTGVSSGAVPLNLVVGGSTASTLSLAFIGGVVASAPTFIYGLSATTRSVAPS